MLQSTETEHATETALSEAFAEAGILNGKTELMALASEAIDAHPRNVEDAAEALWERVGFDGLLLRAMLNYWEWTRKRVCRSIISDAARKRHDIKAVFETESPLRRDGQTKLRSQNGTDGHGANESHDTFRRQNGGGGHTRDDSHLSVSRPSDAKRKAMRKHAREGRNLLGTFLVNGQRIREVTKLELLDSAASDSMNGEFKKLVASMLPKDDAKVSDHLSNEDLEQAYAAAEKAVAA